MITFPNDNIKGYPSSQSAGAQAVGGLERYASLNGTDLTVTNLEATTVKSDWVYAGGIKASQITSEYISGDRLDVTVLNAKNIEAATVKSSWVYAGNIAAGQITSGSITVGGTSQPEALIIQHSTNDSNSRLRFEGGSRIWEDSSNNIGINALGSELDIYIASNLVAYFGTGNVTLWQHLHTTAIDLSCGGQSEGNIENVDTIIGHNDLCLQVSTASGDDAHIKFKNSAGNVVAYVDTTDGKFYTV